MVAALTADGARPAVPGPVVDVFSEQTRQCIRTRGQERGERAPRIVVQRPLQPGQAGPGGVLSETATTRWPHNDR